MVATRKGFVPPRWRSSGSTEFTHHNDQSLFSTTLMPRDRPSALPGLDLIEATRFLELAPIVCMRVPGLHDPHRRLHNGNACLDQSLRKQQRLTELVSTIAFPHLFPKLLELEGVRNLTRCQQVESDLLLLSKRRGHRTSRQRRTTIIHRFQQRSPRDHPRTIHLRR